MMPLTKPLFEDLFTYCDPVEDGTFKYVTRRDLILFCYSYVEKTENYRTLPQSYSVYKDRHLVKSALLVTTNDFILDVQGPYFADGRNNDAAILRNELNQNINDVRNWFREGDIFIVDRGYRDVLPYLDELNLISKMLASLAANQRQLTTEQANQVRLITIQRRIVELRNGHIKIGFQVTGWNYSKRSCS
ncbi:hypothetical protein HHI36_017389 [Cryptolaemus montrouzieri]|uniref:DDE Tnp4 domain-containing protein n=1 Tax=Cryptolaemus montrouzieri TaxID=559131 RepID=A0ABD2NMF2_9CUCU